MWLKLILILLNNCLALWSQFLGSRLMIKVIKKVGHYPWESWKNGYKIIWDQNVMIKANFPGNNHRISIMFPCSCQVRSEKYITLD